MWIQLLLVQWVALVAMLVASTRAAAISSSPGKHGLAVRSVQTTGTLEPSPTRSLTKRSPVYPDNVLKQAAQYIALHGPEFTNLDPRATFFHPAFTVKTKAYNLGGTKFLLHPDLNGPWEFLHSGARRYTLRAVAGRELVPPTRGYLVPLDVIQSKKSKNTLANQRVQVEHHPRGHFIVQFVAPRDEHAPFMLTVDRHGAVHLHMPDVDPLISLAPKAVPPPCPLPPHRPRPNAVYRGPSLRPQRPVKAEINDRRRTQSGRETTQPPSPSSFGNSESTRSSRQASLASCRSQSSLSRSEQADSRRSLP